MVHNSITRHLEMSNQKAYVSITPKSNLSFLEVLQQFGNSSESELYKSHTQLGILRATYFNTYGIPDSFCNL